MVLSAIASYLGGSTIASLVGSWAGWTALSSAAKRFGDDIIRKGKRLIGWGSSNPGAVGSILKGGGVLGGLGIAGWTISDAFDAVGIKDGQLRLAVLGVLGVGVVAALGSLFDIGLGDSNG